MSLSFKTEAYSWRALTLRVVSIIGLLLGIWLSFDETLIDSVTTTPAIAEAVAAPTSAPKNKTVAIREIQPAGHKVLADNPQTPGQAEGDFGEFDSQTWQVLISWKLTNSWNASLPFRSSVLKGFPNRAISHRRTKSDHEPRGSFGSQKPYMGIMT